MNRIVRKDLFVICIIMLVISLVVAFFQYLSIGGQHLLQQSVRFVITVMLSVFVVMDKTWAKWILIVLCAIAGVMGLLFSPQVFARTVIGGILILSMGIFYLFAAVYTFVTKNKLKNSINA